MAADPDSFDNDCRSDAGTLSGEDGGNSEDAEEVQSLLTSIQSARVEQRVHNTVGSKPITVSPHISLLNTAHDSLLHSHTLRLLLLQPQLLQALLQLLELLSPHHFGQCPGTDHLPIS